MWGGGGGSVVDGGGGGGRWSHNETLTGPTEHLK